MRKLRVRHEPLPGVGERFEFPTASGITVIVVTQRSGRRDIALRAPGEDDPLLSVPLTRNESLALATLLMGTHIELSVAPKA
jgi:K+/H+ antiporter YhaU regulatory subunit KhtT